MELSKMTLEIFTQLEHKWLDNHTRKTRILSIDGGGTTGIVSGAALVHLEQQIRHHTNDPSASISDFFDLFTGTGIGAVLAAMLSADSGSGRPLFSADTAVAFLRHHHPAMFKRRGGLFSGKKKMSSRGIDKVLKQVFSELTLKDTCKPLLIPCFDLVSSAPFVFSRADASESPSYNFHLWKVCRATSATPGLFSPFPLTSIDGKTSCLAVDGGLVMNNPTAAAVTHVLHNKRDFPSVNGVEDLLVLSLGNGSSLAPLGTGRNAECCSTSSVVDIVLGGVSETVDQMMGNAFSWNRSDYVRIEGNGSEEEVLKERGVESLPFGGKRLMTETNGERVTNFVKRIVATGKTSLPPSPCKPVAVNALVNAR